jgi:hypothetical protein
MNDPPAETNQERDNIQLSSKPANEKVDDMKYTPLELNVIV